MQWTLKQDNKAEMMKILLMEHNNPTLNHVADREWHQELLQVSRALVIQHNRFEPFEDRVRTKIQFLL